MEKTKRFEIIAKEITSLYAEKNADYGDSFGKTFQEEGFAMSRIRLSDKLSRFKILTNGNVQKVNGESTRDTLMDLAAYAIMTIIEMDLQTILQTDLQMLAENKSVTESQGPAVDSGKSKEFKSFTSKLQSPYMCDDVCHKPNIGKAAANAFFSKLLEFETLHSAIHKEKVSENEKNG